MTRGRFEIVLLRREPSRLTLEALAQCAGVHPAQVERFVEFGLLEPIEWEGAVSPLFDASAISRLRMIKRLRETLGINLAGIAVIQDLVDRFSKVQAENKGLRHLLKDHGIIVDTL